MPAGTGYGYMDIICDEIASGRRVFDCQSKGVFEAERYKTRTFVDVIARQQFSCSPCRCGAWGHIVYPPPQVGKKVAIYY